MGGSDPLPNCALPTHSVFGSMNQHALIVLSVSEGNIDCGSFVLTPHYPTHMLDKMSAARLDSIRTGRKRSQQILQDNQSKQNKQAT